MYKAQLIGQSYILQNLFTSTSILCWFVRILTIFIGLIYIYTFVEFYKQSIVENCLENFEYFLNSIDMSPQKYCWIFQKHVILYISKDGRTGDERTDDGRTDCPDILTVVNISIFMWHTTCWLYYNLCVLRLFSRLRWRRLYNDQILNSPA